MKRSKKVAIVGFAGGFDRIPWQSKGWEIWGFNQFYRCCWPSKKYPFTRWFELHTPDYFVKDVHGNPVHEGDGWANIAAELDLVSRGSAAVEKLLRSAKPFAIGRREITRELFESGLRAQCRGLERGEAWRPIPVYLPKPNKLVPKATVYPRKQVEALTPRGEYHAGSFDWLVALAILEGFTHIQITGVNFALGGEPISARPCLEYWIGVAEGRGIKVDVIGGDCFRIFHLVRSDIPYGFAPWRLIEDAPRG